MEARSIMFVGGCDMKTDPDTASASSASSPLLPTGTMLKHFRVEGLLGEGGMGRVYRAYDSRLHRPVAVKLLSHELTSDIERKQRFFQEARAAARISHPAVAQIFDADEVDGVTFIVMELVEGKTVRQLIESRELDLLGAIDIAIQVADGLAKAHELGIVHRDIKPANLMRTVDGHVKILDFGLAKLLQQTTLAGPEGTQRLVSVQFAPTGANIVMGTPAYMSPEQVRGLPVEARTDIFALGVLLFEMATGQSPFQRANSMDALHAAAFEETPPMNSIRPHIPAELQRIVSRCLRKQAEERYPNARILGEELRRIRRDTETGLAQATPWREHLVNLWTELQELPPSRYGWYAFGLSAVLVAFYFSLAKVGIGGLISLAMVSLFLFRRIRNNSERVQEMFVKNVSKIPEVRLITFRARQVSVVVERPAAQLYDRINGHLRTCNRKLFFGPPMTVAILHELSSDQTRTMLTSPGVEYVRADVVEPGKIPNQPAPPAVVI
jgi:serine/threonine protein kinase